MRTEIIVILDRSGSMATIKEATIEGLSSFIEQQKAEAGEALLTFVQFDHRYDLCFEAKPIHEVGPLQLIPNGTTALLDAIGRTIVEQGRRFDAASPERKPELVVVAIFTDGMENASKDYDRGAVLQLVTEQRTRWGWDFYFIGANQNAILSAGRLGIGADQAITYAASTRGVAGAMGVLNRAVSSSRKGDTYQVTDADRRATI